MSTTFSSLGQIALTVSNIETATSFYREKLELPFLFSAPPKLAFFDLNGVRLMISEPEEGESLTGNSTLYFRVDDIHAAYALLKDRGVTLEDAPHLIATLGTTEVWMAFFRDPDRNLLGIMSEIPLQESGK